MKVSPKLSRKYLNKKSVLSLAIVFIVISFGTLVIHYSSAAYSTATIQPEYGDVSFRAEVVYDLSGNDAVKFKNPGIRITNTDAINALTNATSLLQVEQITQSFLSQYNLSFELTNISPSSYIDSFATYSVLSSSDLQEAKLLGQTLVDEWSKYPVNWVKQSKLQRIKFVKSLKIGGYFRAATPDSIDSQSLYYNTDYAGYGEYIRHVIHHEYAHLFMYNYFQNIVFPGDTWSAYNATNFTYGNGGYTCYIPGNDCLSGYHPVPGFVTGYSTSALEEDQAEIYAYLMTTPEYRRLVEWTRDDPILLNKVNYYKQFIATKSPQMNDAYFESINP